MTIDSKTSPSELNSDDEARHWYSLIHLGEMSKTDKLVFEAWLNASEGNRAAFERVDKLWSLLGHSDQIEAWNAAIEESGDLHNQIQRPYWREVFTTRRIAIGGAVAASLALMVSMIVFNRMIQAPVPETSLYASTIAETKTILLEDGSVLTLSGASEAMVNFTEKVRSVELVRGSAYFDVASNPDRPMFVAVADTEVRVIGTAFGVRLGPKDVRVAVTEGQVLISDVSSANQTVTASALLAGERVVTALDGALIDRGAADIDSELAWIKGRFVFDGAPLVDVVNDINRYRVKQVDVIGEAASMEITSSFKVDQIDQFLSGLPVAYRVEVTNRMDRTIISAR